MDYQNYEEYMRNVLGYNEIPNNIYNTYPMSQDYYYDAPANTRNDEELNLLYPEIYKLVYPMVCKVCNENENKQTTRELLENMCDEIYRNVEPEDRGSITKIPLKNGDVRNPNSKETELRRDTRQNNVLRDLIKILILRELLMRERPRRPRTTPPPPYMPNRPGPQIPPIYRPGGFIY